MYICPTHGAAPWSSQFGCMYCMGQSIPVVPTPQSRPLSIGPSGVREGLALSMWWIGFSAAIMLLGIGGLILFTLGRLFDWTVLSTINWLGQFDSSGAVTGTMWWGYFLIFVVLLIGTPILWVAWMLFWGDPKSRKAFWRLVGLSK